MGIHSVWAQHAFILPRALAPVAIQYISMRYLHFTWPTWLAMIIYSGSFAAFANMTLSHMNGLALKHGFLDAHVARDGVPDVRLKATVLGLIFVLTSRPLSGCFVAYDRFQLPTISPWLPVHMFIFITVLDFWFYVYHRAMHEIDFLWRFHKTHHMAKHPNPLLSAFADPEQDLFDNVIIPMMTYVTYPVDFFTWWLCTLYIIYVEAAGHTGIRVYWQQPITGPILRHFGMDLVLEDHDLHHRSGWRKSSNYGKQTRVWDKLFGTTRPRLEMVDENVDW